MCVLFFNWYDLIWFVYLAQGERGIPGSDGKTGPMGPQGLQGCFLILNLIQVPKIKKENERNYSFIKWLKINFSDCLMKKVTYFL